MASDIHIDITDRHGRRCASSGARWEPITGYSRAVRAGEWILVSGTVGINADGTYPDGMAEQTARSLEIIQAAIEALGGRIEHVIRTRIYTTDISQWEQIASVHGRLFADLRPATTLVEVAKLADPRALVEIDADAIVQ